MNLKEHIRNLLMQSASRRIEPQLQGYKRKLFGGLSGKVLELGPGTGVNFPFFSRNIEWIGIEPNIDLHPELLMNPLRPGKARVMGVQEDQRLRLEDNSVDHVVCSFVLCSVDDPQLTLGELQRVLRVGGTFRFIEHVASPKGTCRRVLQNTLTPLTRYCVGNCHINRDTEAVLRSSFATVMIETLSLKSGIPGLTHAGIMGTATKH